MSEAPRVEFLSLFVLNLDASVEQFRTMLGVEPEPDPGLALAPHPFASKGPVVFQLGHIALALYECDSRTTHPGDLGIGLRVDDLDTVHRFGAVGGQIFWGPNSLQPISEQLAIGVTSDRHFFEIVGTIPVSG
jgi:hypothetical protein